MFLIAEFIYKSHGILSFFPRNHSPRCYFQKTVFLLCKVFKISLEQSRLYLEKITPKGVITQEETEYTM